MIVLIVLVYTVALLLGSVYGQEIQDGIFLHGVASGDPLSDRVIIWTRVTVDSPAQGVQWEMSLDYDFQDVVKSGQTVTCTFDDFTVKVDVEGLEPDTEYYYRFSTVGFFSPIGKTKTLPIGEVEEIQLAVVSNANWRQGFFNVYNAVSNIEGLDLVLITGDYIMPYASDEYPDYDPDYSTDQLSAREGLIPEGEPESLDEFRQRYALYRTDTDLQKLHSSVAVIAMWDDKEFEEDAYSTDARNHVDVFITWEQKKQNALQAYLEWMPIRLSLNNQTHFYRSFSLGNLAILSIPETRISERSAPVDAEAFAEDISSALPLDYSLWNKKLYDTVSASLYQNMSSTQNKILGAQQLQWLQQQIQQGESEGVAWNLMMMGSPLGSSHFPDLIRSLQDFENEGDSLLLNTFLQLFLQEDFTRYALASAYFKLPADPDTWDGYSYERDQLYELLGNAAVPSIVLSGDANARAGQLVQENGKVVGIEFTAPSVSDKSYLASFGDAVGNSLNVDWTSWFHNGLVQSNPGMKFADIEDSGFLVVTIGQISIESTFYIVNTTMEKEFGVICKATFSVSRDDPTNLLPNNCTTQIDVFVPNTVQLLTSQQLNAQKSEDVTSPEDMLAQAVFPFVINATASGEEVDMNAIMQTPEIQNLMFDFLMDNFTDLTNIDLNNENDQDAAASIVQMVMRQFMLNGTTDDTNFLADTNSTGAYYQSQSPQFVQYAVQSDDIQGNSSSEPSDAFIGEILPLVLNTTLSGEEVDVSTIMQTPEISNLIFDQIMANFTDLTGLTMTTQDDQNAASALIQMVMQAVLNETANTSVSDSNSSIGVSAGLMSPIPMFSPIDIAQAVNQQAPLDATGKWTSMLLNKELLYSSQDGVGLVYSTATRSLTLKDDATFTASYENFFSNLLGSGGSSQSKEGFWSVEESTGTLYLQVTFCDSAANSLLGNGGVSTSGVVRTSTCPIDDEQYQLSEGTQSDTIFLGDQEFFISDIEG